MTRRPAIRRRHPFAIACLSIALLADTAVAATPASHGVEHPTVIVRVEGGFHWLDAAIGAVTTAALALLVFGLTLIVRHANERN